MYHLVFLQSLLMTVGGLLEKLALSDKNCTLDAVAVSFVYSSAMALVLFGIMMSRNGTQVSELRSPRNLKAVKFILGSVIFCSAGIILYFHTLKHMDIGARFLFAAPVGMFLSLSLSYFFLHEPIFDGKQYAMALYLAAGYVMYRVSDQQAN